MVTNIENLLKPRFEVIADFPNNHFGKVGTILDRNWARYPNDDESQPPIWRISDFPHIFKPLNWWEHRAIEEMPRYLKIDNYKLKLNKSRHNNFDYYKILRWDMDSMIGILSESHRSVCSIMTFNPEYTYQPCSEEEYLFNR